MPSRSRTRSSPGMFRILYLITGGGRYKRYNTQDKPSPELLARFRERWEALKHDPELVRTILDSLRRKPVRVTSRVRVLAQPNTERLDTVRPVSVVRDTSNELTLSGYYFYADGKLYQGYQDLEDVNKALEMVIGNEAKNISDVEYKK